jgi:putative PIN family toxin of toxin-antitoxin system
MRRAVLDTNVVVSALLQPAGPPGNIIELGFGGRFRWYISEPILAEYAVVLSRKRLGIDGQRASKFLKDLRKVALPVVPGRNLRECSDPNDDKFLECALQARADYVVTGNVRHFPERFQRIRVILPRQFLLILASDPASA